KGAGEAGTVGSLSAGINAVVDALSVYGIRHIDMPCTPYRVWRAIEEAKKGPTPAHGREELRRLSARWSLAGGWQKWVIARGVGSACRRFDTNGTGSRSVMRGLDPRIH